MRNGKKKLFQKSSSLIKLVISKAVSYVDENIGLIQGVMFHTKQEEKPDIAIFVDFRQAFDTVEWDYLKAALLKFNFGPDILNRFDVNYNNASSFVLHNEQASDFF